MTVNEAINKIKLMLSAQEEAAQESTVEQTFAEATLVDGTVVKVEGDLEIGKPLFVVTEEGDVPAPEGMHETTNGLIVTVDEAGVITNIEEKAAAEAPEEEVVVEAEKENFSEDLVNQIGAMIKPALEAVEALKSEIATLKGEFSAFKDEPAAKKITNNLEEFKAEQRNFGDARFAQIQKIRADKFK